MTARALWKGVLRFGDIRVPVKLYAAVEERSVQFRLLHRADRAPVRQAMVNPETGETVPYSRTRRAYAASYDELVVLGDEELSELAPEASREIEILHFLPQRAIDHRWYLRPYYLGPDDADGDYAALAEALASSGREGLARWVMRGREYLGALRLHQGYPALISLRHAEEVVDEAALQVASGTALDERELAMASQLIGLMQAPFEPSAWRDEYRDRVLELIEAKRRGERVTLLPIRRAEPSDDLARALEASLRQERRRA